MGGGRMQFAFRQGPMRLAAVVSVGLLLAGCATAGKGSAVSRNQTVSMIVAGAGATSQAEIASASTLLASKCMRAKGFSYATPPPAEPQSPRSTLSPLLHSGELAYVPPETAALNAAREGGFGLAAARERATAARTATGQAPAFAAGSSSSTAPYHPSPHEKAYEVALNGPKGQNGSFTVAGIAQHTYTTEGCLANAYKTLYGSPLLAVEASYLPEDLNLVVTHDLYSNPSYVDAARQWSDCMARNTSHRPSDPYKIGSELLAGEEGGTGPVTAAERAYEVKVALADTRCQYSSGFLKTSVALRRRFATQLSGPYEGLLLTLVEARARASRKAEAVLAAAGR
jgi:hypothetical protein